MSQYVSLSQPLVLVTASSGKTGRRIVPRLNARGMTVRAGSRSGQPPFDWAQPTTWGPALRGATAAYIAYAPDLAAPGGVQAIETFVSTARDQGVRQLVLLSGRGEPEALACEACVRASGLDWTVVRSSWFSQNFSEGFLTDFVRSGVVALPVADVAEPFVSVDDVADVAVVALSEPGHSGQVYDVTGPRALTFGEAAAEIAQASGRDVRFQAVTPRAFSDALTGAGVSPDDAEFLCDLFTTVLDGRNASCCDGVPRALGRAPQDFRDVVNEANRTGAWSAIASMRKVGP